MSRASRRPAPACGLTSGERALTRIRLWQIALGVLAGNLLLHQLPVLPSVAVLSGLSLAALVGSRSWPLPALVCLSFVWTAWIAGHGLDARWPADADGADVALTGWVDTLPSRDTGRTVFSLRVVDGDDGRASLPRRVRLSWYDPAPAIAAGQALEVEARLRSPRGLVNPGGFDYERWLFLESYDATGYVRSGRVDPARTFGLAQSWLGFRARLAAELGRRIDDTDARALIQALSLGERSEFTDRHWTVFSERGRVISLPCRVCISV